jgi:predicted MPP superfamily phosphohydrolase
MFEINHIDLVDKQLPDAFNDTVIVHVSDLHSANYGEKQEDLLSSIKNANPDFIAITGDLIDSNYNEVDIAMNFINGAVKIAPTFYVTGNHEAWTSLYIKLEKALVEAGVILLRDEVIKIQKDDQTISIIGLDDPDFFQIQTKANKHQGIMNYIYKIRGKDGLVNNGEVATFSESQRSRLFENIKSSIYGKVSAKLLEQNKSDLAIASLGADSSAALEIDLPSNKNNNFISKLNHLSSQTNDYSIVLSHRPEFFKDFVKAKANLVLTGHTHGGQVRFPILGNVYSPHQGLFPKYSDGLYEEDYTKMIISRGLGNSGLPFRLNNPAELIIIKLKKHRY